MAEEQLTIGELARRTGVATSALRYWEEFGLLPAAVRVAGQRRYPPSSVALVGEILVLRDAGYTLQELRTVVGSYDRVDGAWRELAKRKLAELDEQIARAQAARTAVAHGLACPHEDIRACPNYTRIVAARLGGAFLGEGPP